MNTNTPNKPSLALINGFVRTEKPTPQLQDHDANALHTMVISRLPVLNKV